LGSDAGNHGSHRETHAFVAVNDVGKDFRSGGNGDSTLVAEFVETTFHAKVVEPELAVSSTTGHGSQHFVTWRGGRNVSLVC